VKVAVIGAGIMGSGIAQISAMSGYDVAMVDTNTPALERGLSEIDTSLARFEKSGKISAAERKVSRTRIHATLSLEDAVAGTEFVIEAVPEVLDVKREVFARIATAAPTTAVLGTNTSQYSVGAIAASLGAESSRVIGTHFFNPPVMMKLVELVVGSSTSTETVERARSYAESLGKEVVVCRTDTPGFIATRAYAAFRLECVRMLEEGVASAGEIDKALRLGFGLPMGPLELGDFNGLDTFLYAVSSLAEAYGERFAPTAGLVEMVAAGRLGRKAGAGFYTYETPSQRPFS
jgi:3-hydroxybutyryl-CoA dehydrogenase